MNIPLEEISFEASRARGPGGQHVQKTSSRITARWHILESTSLSPAEKQQIIEKLKNRITKENELLVHVETHRSQHRNKRLAHYLLNALVTEALKTKKPRKKTKPKKSSIEARLKDKSLRGQQKASRKPNFEQD